MGVGLVMNILLFITRETQAWFSMPTRAAPVVAVAAPLVAAKAGFDGGAFIIG